MTDIQMAYYNLYAALMMAHLKMIKDFMKSGTEEVVYVPEANTYQHSNVTLWRYVKDMAMGQYGITLKVYMQYRPHTKMWDIGRLVTINKANMVMALHEAILSHMVGRNAVVFSFGVLIRSVFVKQKNLLKYRYKIDLDQAVQPMASVSVDDVTPKHANELFRLTPAQCVDYIFNVIGGKDLFITRFNKTIGDDGKSALDKLIVQMGEITLRKTDKGSLKVITGGKKPNYGMSSQSYTRDDLFSAILLAVDVFSPVTASTWMTQEKPEEVRGSSLFPVAPLIGNDRSSIV